MGPDGDDDEEVEKKAAHAISVSYVDFDKTKPYGPKQIGDGLPPAASRNNSKLANQVKNNTDIPTQAVNGKSILPKTKNVQSEISVADRNKNKRQSKIVESEQKQQEATLPKPSKKHKRDIQ